MQRVVRSTLFGLSLMGLAACGDKVTNVLDTTKPVTQEQVTAVTVVPGNLQLAVGGTASLVATVTATPGITDRTVTWSSSNTAVATVSASGVVTGVGAGTAAIVATSKADSKVTGAAAVTVTSTPLVTVTISTINTTVPGTGSVPANLSNFGTASPVGTSQLDVTLNVDGPIAGAAVIVTCGTKADTVTQGTFPNAAPIVDGDASAASAPVTLSINTARLDANLVPRLLNGQCTIRGAVKTASGTQAITANTPLTLSNADVSIVSVTVPNRASDNQGKVWFGNGSVTITATPVLYSGRTAGSVNIGLAAGTGVGANTNTCTATSPLPPFGPIPATGSGSTWTAVFPATAGATNTLFGVACSNLVPTVTVTDVQGAVITATQPFTVGTTTADRFTPTQGTFALDEQKPAPGAFPIANNALQNTGANGYVSGNFRFVADSAAGYTGPNAATAPQNVVFTDRTATCSPAGVACNLDNGGVDRVTVRFQWRVAGAAASTYADLTSAAALSETATSTTNQFRMITADALGNADTTTLAASTFGVDKTAPTVTITGPGPNTTSTVNGSQGPYVIAVSDALSGPGVELVAQTRLSQDISTSTSLTAAEGVVFTAGSAGAATDPCAIGRFNASQANSSAGALPAYERGGTIVGYCSPIAIPTGTNIASNDMGRDGYFTTTIIGTDAAGNRTAATTTTIADDPTAPTVASIDMPPTITGNATPSFPASASDNMDITSSWAAVNYATPSNGGPANLQLAYLPVAGPGVAFDNVLTRSATIAPTVPNFIKNLQANNGSAGVTAPVTAGNASSITVTAVDEAFNVGSNSAAIAPAVTLNNGASSSFSTATFTAGWGAGGGGQVSNVPSGTTPAFATTTTLTATAGGTTGTFANPFVGGAVSFWYQLGGVGPWYFIGNAGAGAATDNGTNRFWTYSFTWDPPALAQNGTSLIPPTGGSIALTVRAIGVNSNGDGVLSPPVTVTLTNP